MSRTFKDSRTDRAAIVERRAQKRAESERRERAQKRSRVYLFGIGSPEWQAETGHTINAYGVPVPSHGPSPRRVVVSE
jgi:hypothetical protein